MPKLKAFIFKSIQVETLLENVTNAGARWKALAKSLFPMKEKPTRQREMNYFDSFIFEIELTCLSTTSG